MPHRPTLGKKMPPHPDHGEPLPRLIAPPDKVIPFLEGLIAKGREAIAAELKVGAATDQVQAWRLLAFEALRSAFEGEALRA